MNTQNMSANLMAVKCKEGTRRESTGTTKTGASIFSSDSHKKYLPTYLKTHKSSCHDHCKYGIKYRPELDRKGSSLNSFGKEVKHKDTLRVNNLDLQEARKRVGIKKTLMNVDRPNVIKQKALPQIKETRLVKEHIISKKINATGRQAIACMASKTEGNHDREMTKDIGITLHESETNGGSRAKEPASPLKKVPPGGHNVLKKAPTKNSTIPSENHRFKQSSLASSKIDSVTEPAEPGKGKTILKTKGRSLLPTQGSNSLKNEGYNTRTTRGIARKVEERTAKPQVPSPSSKHHDINGSTCKPIVMMNPAVEDVEGKIACATELQANSNSDGLQQRLLSSMNHELVSVTQTSLNLENDILDSPQDDSPKSECIDLSFLKPSLPEAEYFYLNCIQQESNNVMSSENSAVYDEENEEENSAITELSESELETEKTKTVSVTKTKEDSRISELSEASLASSKIDSVTEPAKPGKGKTILKTKGRSLLPTQGSNSNTRTTRGITRKVEERTAKPQAPSHSSKHHDINGSTCKPIVMVNPAVEDVEGKIACATELQANSNSDGLQQRLLSSMNHELVSVTQTSLNLENDILDSPQDDSPKSECIDLSFLKPSLPEAEYFYLNCIQQESNNVMSSENSAVYDEENEEENSAITELSESELETEKTKTVSVTKTKEESRISELSEAEYETENISCHGTKMSMSEGRIKEGAIVHPEENLSAPYMLRFGRSTTQNSEIGDCDQVGREGLLEMPTLEAVPTDLDPGMSKVALRHQVVHDKKDIQGLFNIVLEETAIKLAENRKNKVQALVEAFETAISLQGKKLASTT